MTNFPTRHHQTEFPGSRDQDEDRQRGWDGEHHQEEPEQGQERTAGVQRGVDHYEGVGHHGLDWDDGRDV